MAHPKEAHSKILNMEFHKEDQLEIPNMEYPNVAQYVTLWLNLNMQEVR